MKKDWCCVQLLAEILRTEAADNDQLTERRLGLQSDELREFQEYLIRTGLATVTRPGSFDGFEVTTRGEAFLAVIDQLNVLDAMTEGVTDVGTGLHESGEESSAPSSHLTRDSLLRSHVQEQAEIVRLEKQTSGLRKDEQRQRELVRRLGQVNFLRGQLDTRCYGDNESGTRPSNASW